MSWVLLTVVFFNNKKIKEIKIMKHTILFESIIFILICFYTVSHAQELGDLEFLCDGHVYHYVSHGGVGDVTVEFIVLLRVYYVEEEAEPVDVYLKWMDDSAPTSGGFTAGGEFPEDVLRELTEEYEVEDWELIWSRAQINDYPVMSKYNWISHTSLSIYPEFYIEYNIEGDVDIDGIPDDEEEAIAEQFKPLLIKNVSVQNPEHQHDLGNFELTIHNNSRIKKVWIIGESTDWYYNVTNAHKWNDDNYWCTHGDRSITDNSYVFDIMELTLENNWVGAPVGQRPLYYHVYRDADYFYVQYWYWFNMNDISGQTMKHTWHEGDWEHISIKLEKYGSNYTPIAINLYQHLGGHTKHPDEGIWVAGIEGAAVDDIYTMYDEENTHPVIFIASNSHASYFYDDPVYHMSVRSGPILHEEFIDEVDYGVVDIENLEWNEYETFTYDHLEKLGEAKRIFDSFWHGIHFYFHVKTYPNSKEWLGYRGYCGEFWGESVLNVYPVATPSPRVPFRGWDYYGFTENFSYDGFGNSDYPNWLGLGIAIISWIYLGY